MQYKYSQSYDERDDASGGSTEDIPRKHSKRANKKSKKTSKKAVPKASTRSGKNTTVTDMASNMLVSMKSVVDTIKAIGNSEIVKITWYDWRNHL